MEVIMCASQVKTIRSHRKCWAHSPALNSSHVPPLLSSPLHIPVRNLEKVTLCLEQPSREHYLPGAIPGLLRIFSCPSAQGRRVEWGTGARQTGRCPGRLLVFRGTPPRASTLDNCLCYTPRSPISHLVNMLTTSPGGPMGSGVYLPISSGGLWNRPHWSFFWWYLIWTYFHWLNSTPSFNKRIFLVSHCQHTRQSINVSSADGQPPTLPRADLMHATGYALGNEATRAVPPFTLDKLKPCSTLSSQEGRWTKELYQFNQDYI